MDKDVLKRLEILEVIVNKLTFLLPEKLRLELDEEVSRIKNSHWEDYMGEDL